jgi:hypothetical protein
MIYSFYNQKGNIFFSTIKEFNSFYLRSEYSLKIGPHYYKPCEDFDLMIFANQVTDQTDLIRFRYRFEDFNREGIEPFNYESSLTFRFEDTKWSLETSDKKDSIEKLYSEELSEQELKRLINHEAKKHSASIQQKIENTKNNK